MAVAVLWALGGAFAERVAGQDNEDCLECHAKAGLKVDHAGREVSLFVDPEAYDLSVHAGLDCIECHPQLTDVEDYPHATGLDRVDCTECHDDDDGPIAAFWESTHGLLVESGDKDAPRCQDCHGSHAILPLAHRNSSISPFNIPRMCAQCHAEGAEVQRTHNIPQEQILQRYKQSIHGEGLFKQGLVVTAVCTSCHTGHNVLPHTDPKSSIHKDNVTGTCMTCHGLIEEVHRKVIAGELWERTGIIPICVECHSPHEARKVFYDTNMSNADCLRCHVDATTVSSEDGRSLYVDPDEYGNSIHGRENTSCAQCHTGVEPSKERACATITEPVNCSICHEPEVTDYDRGRHGMLHAAGDANAPYCTDCHGTHGILEHEILNGEPEVLKKMIRESPSYGRNVPALCGKCHREGGQAAIRYFGPQTDIIEHYKDSIHGKGLLESGLTVTATCTDCHSAHKELPRSDPESTVSKQKIAATCGRCHDGIYEKYQKSIHSPEGNPDYEANRRRGMPELPHCDDCHSSHTVKRTDVRDFQLGIMEQCGKCHEEVASTYRDTYHGKASELGDTTRAKCQDCHGDHFILPAENAESTLHRDNVVATCAECHPGSHRQFAGYLTHATHHDPEKYPALYYAFWGMTSLLVGTFSFFGIHTLFWFPRAWKDRKQHRSDPPDPELANRYYVRFTGYQRSLHLMIIVSFFGLALTGMVLKFAYSDWAQLLIRFFGGVEEAGLIHRICAIITFLYFALHLMDVFRRYRQGNKTLFQFFFGPDSMVPTFVDVKDFLRTARWFLGMGPRPNYGRWTYWEKFDYFAVFWGVAIIGTTGLCLWFPEIFTRLIPGWWINVATIIHSDEALLATGFIFTIHFFNTHFRPDKFPMDTVIFTGQMPLEELKRDKPALFEEIKRSGELEQCHGEPVSRTFRRGVKVLGFTALVIGFTLVGLIIYAMLFSYR